MRRQRAAAHPHGKQQPLALSQGGLDQHGGMRLLVRLLDAHLVAGQQRSPDDGQAQVLLPAVDHRADLRDQVRRTGHPGIVGRGFEPHGQRQFAAGALHDAHQAVAGAILARPGVVVHLAELPGRERLHRHKVGEHQFPRRAGKARLQDVAATQIALGATDRRVGGRDLEIASPFSVQQATKNGGAIEVGQTSPVHCSIGSNQHNRMAVPDDSICVYWLIPIKKMRSAYWFIHASNTLVE